MDESVEEELRIMEERASEPPALSADVFREPIQALGCGPVQTLESSASVREAIEVMQQGSFGSVIITEGGKLAGIVTERDVLMKVVGHAEAVMDGPVSAVMTRDPEWLRTDDPIAFVMNRMHVGGFRHVPIVDGAHRPIHVVSIRDALAHLLDRFRDHVVNIPPDPHRGPSERYGG